MATVHMMGSVWMSNSCIRCQEPWPCKVVRNASPTAEELRGHPSEMTKTPVPPPNPKTRTSRKEWKRLAQKFNTWAVHYPVCVRRGEPDGAYENCFCGLNALGELFDAAWTADLGEPTTPPNGKAR